MEKSLDKGFGYQYPAQGVYPPQQEPAYGYPAHSANQQHGPVTFTPEYNQPQFNRPHFQQSPPRRGRFLQRLLACLGCCCVLENCCGGCCHPCCGGCCHPCCGGCCVCDPFISDD